jgi:hypothetical protein
MKEEMHGYGVFFYKKDSEEREMSDEISVFHGIFDQNVFK